MKDPAKRLLDIVTLPGYLLILSVSKGKCKFSKKQRFMMSAAGIYAALAENEFTSLLISLFVFSSICWDIVKTTWPFQASAVASNRPTEALALVISLAFVVYST